MWHIVLDNTQPLKQINNNEDNNTVMCSFRKVKVFFYKENGNKEIKKIWLTKKKWFIGSQKKNHCFLHGLMADTFSKWIS